ncbi:hypothetical protein [Desulfosarcina cetonica]|uniref:hypothetical protein n=1 Tax=Desulfosarcina cetonica TaxID=90730 RepID=UPI0012ED38E9|nr:hypothetical protein [Desulfosarcina cetonica]
MNESRPTLSLIKYLETDRNGFVLDLAQADGEPPCGALATVPTPRRCGPPSRPTRASVLRMS